MKMTTDPVEALQAVTRRSCNAMHMINRLMAEVREMRTKHCYDENTCPNGELGSARSPECLDRIMDELIYMMECEANCGVGSVIYSGDGAIEANICEFDDSHKPKC